MSIKLKDTISDLINKANKDGSGNTITSTYLKLSGGTIDAGGSKAPLILKGGTGGYREGLRIMASSNGWSDILLAGTDATEASGTSEKSWFFGNNDGKLYINKNNSNSSSGSELCNIDGNWGIATVTPSYKLHVNGSFYATSGSINGNTILHAGNYTTYCAKASHTHSSILDSGNSTATTFAYSKSGLGYDDYTWLAGWNGYELRAVAKSQFAKASHGTHLSGSANLTSQSTTGIACDNATYNLIGYYTSGGPSTSLGATTNDGTLYSQAYSTSWVSQIAQDYRDGDLFTRGKNNGTWTSWKKVAYTSDIPTSLPANGGNANTVGNKYSSDFKYVKVGEYSYTPNLAYYGGSSTTSSTYYKLSITKVNNIWTMLYVEISVKENYSTPTYGKLLLHLNKNNSNGISGFFITTLGKFSDNIKAYASNNSSSFDIYIAGNWNYSTINIDRVSFGDTSSSTAGKEISLTTASSLPESYSTATTIVGITSNNYTSYVNTTNFPGLNKTGTVTSITVTGSNGLSGSGTITSSGTITLSNSGVRSISTGATNGTIKVNTGGTEANIAVKGLGSAAYTESTAYATSGHNHDSTYLKLSGGTMTGTITMNTGTGIQMKYDRTEGGNPWMYANGADTFGIRYFEGDPDKMVFSASGNAKTPATADLCINGNGDGTVTIRGNTIYHSGNLSLSNYVTLNSAQTITAKKTFSVSTYPSIVCNCTTGNETNIHFTVQGANKGYVGYNSTHGTWVYNSTAAKYLAINDSGVPHVSGSTIWHAGNDGSGSGLDADLLDGKHASSFSTTGHTHNYAGSSSAGGVATSANKLATARTLWGQSFDGTANVDGVIKIKGTYGSYTEGIRIYPASNNWTTILLAGADNTADTGTSTKSWSIHNNDGNFYINKNGSSTDNKEVLCNVGGYWGVGTTVLTDSPTLSVAKRTSGAIAIFRNDTNTSTEPYIYLYCKTSPKAAFTWQPTSYGASIFSSACSKYLGIKDDGTPHFHGNTLIHAGNYTSYCAKASHTHSSILDSGNSTTTTFAYSKDGLGYDSYTWLAGWNGYELRAINKSQFARASHGTHLSGSASLTSQSTTGVACDNATYNLIGYYTSGGPSTSLGATTNDGTLYSQAYSTSWVTQIAQDYRDGDLFTRGKNNGTWTSWKKVAYTSDIPTIPSSLPANGGNADTTDSHHFSTVSSLPSSPNSSTVYFIV